MLIPLNFEFSQITVRPKFFEGDIIEVEPDFLLKIICGKIFTD